jgi:hypothetical protein
MRFGPLVTSAAFLLAVACGRHQPPAAPMRSPSLDYPAPDITTSDGEVVGADRQAPRDKLASGLHVGSDGIQSGGPPGTKEPKGSAPAPQPCAEIGLKDASGHPQCAHPAPAPAAHPAPTAPTAAPAPAAPPAGAK